MPPMPTRCSIIVRSIRPWELYHAVTRVLEWATGWRQLAKTDTRILEGIIAIECDRLDKEAAALQTISTVELLPITRLVKYGDLSLATEDMIIHQTNCVSTRAAGLARYLFQKFPYADTYASRTKPTLPGTATTCGTSAHRKVIVNLNAQYYPGAPRPHTKDSRQNRLQYFDHALSSLAQHIHRTRAHPCSVAFPWRIGCGLAKGQWRLYSTLIMDWIARTRTTDNHPITVTVYQLLDRTSGGNQE